jgi:hypothetical protein
MRLLLGLACRSLRRTPDPIHPWTRIIHESHPRWQNKNDKIDSYKLATLLRGGNFPTAYPYPAKWRATRDLIRRRMYISRRCGKLVAHIQNTNTQYNLPAFGKKLSHKYNHDGVAERFEDPQVRKSVEADLL